MTAAFNKAQQTKIIVSATNLALPSQVATKNLDLPTMQLLLQHTADVSDAGAAGRTALHIAITRASTEAAELLLAAGANINCK